MYNLRRNVLIMLRFFTLYVSLLDTPQPTGGYHKQETKSGDKYHKKSSLEDLNEQEEEEEECNIKADTLEINHSTPFTELEQQATRKIPNFSINHSWCHSANRLDRIAIVVLPPVYVLIVSVYWISYLSRYDNSHSINFQQKII